MKKYKIILVDDDELILSTARLCLRPIASKLDLASSGGKCIEMLTKDHDYDIVLLDFMLPDMNGLEILQYIRSSDTLSHLPVLIQTGMLVLDTHKISNLGSEIIYKPYSRQEIYDMIELCCMRRST